MSCFFLKSIPKTYTSTKYANAIQASFLRMFSSSPLPQTPNRVYSLTNHCLPHRSVSSLSVIQRAPCTRPLPTVGHGV